MSRDEEIRQSAGKVAIRDNKGQYAHGFLMQALREAFTEGARWADRTMIKRTSQWLQENAAMLWESPCNPDRIVEQFRKAMQDE